MGIAGGWLVPLPAGLGVRNRVTKDSEPGGWVARRRRTLETGHDWLRSSTEDHMPLGKGKGRGRVWEGYHTPE